MSELQDDKLHESVARLQKRLEPELEEIKKADDKRDADAANEADSKDDLTI